MSCEGCCEVRVSYERSGQGHFVVKVEVDCEGHFVGVVEDYWEEEGVVGWVEVEEFGSG